MYVEDMKTSISHIKGQSRIFNMSGGIFFYIFHLKIYVQTFILEIWNTVCFTFVKQASI